MSTELLLEYTIYLFVFAEHQNFDYDYLLNTVAEHIASNWYDIGIELQIDNLDNFKDHARPTRAKFEVMLHDWLKKQTGSKATIVDKFCAAMERIDLVTPAEEFFKKMK